MDTHGGVEGPDPYHGGPKDFEGENFRCSLGLLILERGLQSHRSMDIGRQNDHRVGSDRVSDRHESHALIFNSKL